MRRPGTRYASDYRKGRKKTGYGTGSMSMRDAPPPEHQPRWQEYEVISWWRLQNAGGCVPAMAKARRRRNKDHPGCPLMRGPYTDKGLTILVER